MLQDIGESSKPYSLYNSFFTSYAVLALCDASGDYKIPVNKACKWLKGQQKMRGDFGDLASSLMTIAALQKVYGPMFELKLPLPIFLRIQTTLSSAETK